MHFQNHKLKQANFLHIFILFFLFSCSSNEKTDAEYLMSAKNNYAQNNIKATVIELKNALRINPSNIEARLMLGKLYIEANNGKAAAKELLKAKDLGANKTTWIVDLAQAYLLQREFEKTLDITDNLPQLTENESAEINALRGDALTMKNDLELANRAYEKSIEIDPKQARAYLGKANLAYRKKQFDTALKLIEQALESGELAEKSWIAKARIEEALNDEIQALTSYTKALEANPKNLTALTGIASIEIQNNKLDAARVRINKALSINAKYPAANYFDALLKLNDKKIDEAEQPLKIVLEYFPNHSQALLMMGQLQFLKGNPEQAENYLSKYVAKFPDQGKAAMLLSSTYLSLNDPLRAIEVLRGVEGQLSDDVFFLTLFGSALMKTGQPDEAVKYYSTAIEIDPQGSQLQLQLGASLLATGEIEQATRALKTAAELAKDSRKIHELLFDAYIASNKFSSALELANNIIKNNPEEPYGYVLRGSAYVFLNDLQKAREAFNKANKNNYVPAILKLAGLSEIESNIKDAKNLYHKVLKIDKKNVNGLIALSRIAKSEGNSTESEKYLINASSSNPKSIQAGTALTRFYIAKQSTLKALKIANELSNNLPNNTSVLENLIQAQLNANQIENASASADRLIKLVPGSVKALVLAARVKFVAKDSNSAQTLLENALEKDSSAFNAHYLLASIKINNNEFDNAQDIANYLRKAAPTLEYAWLIEGDIHSAKKDFAKAENAYKKAAQKNDNSKTAYLKLAKLQKNMGNAEKGTSTLKKWLESHPNDLEIRAALAILLREINQIKEAIAEYEYILNIKHDHMIALNNISWLYLDLNDKKAIESAKHAYSLNSENPYIVDTYGWILTKFEKTKQGTNILLDASKLAPENPEIRYHLAYAYYKNDDKETARKEIELIKDSEIKPDLAAKINELKKLL